MTSVKAGNGGKPDQDNLYKLAIEVLVSEQSASTAFLQRRLSIGYNKAAALMLLAELEGVVSAPNHVGKRELLVRSKASSDIDHIKSTDDARVANSPKRHQYRVLSDAEKARMAALKSKGQELLNLIEGCGASRELTVARTRAEEAVMWAVKHVTS